MHMIHSETAIPPKHSTTGSTLRLALRFLLVSAAVAVLMDAPAHAQFVCRLSFEVSTGDDGLRGDSIERIRVGGQEVVFDDTGTTFRFGEDDARFATYTWTARLMPCALRTRLRDGFEFEHESPAPDFMADNWNLQGLVIMDLDTGEIYFDRPPSGERLHRFLKNEDQIWNTVDAVRDLLDEASDMDGDGLPDVWETEGADLNGDGSIDLDLPGLGANSMHKDLFWEVDWTPGNGPSRADIAAIKAAFAAAPVDAGGVANPDGLMGINLWVDTGSLSDPLASEDGAGVGTCGDGLDNGSDGADALDPDCLTGDDLGGGNVLPAVTFTDLDSDDDMNGLADFYVLKAGNFTYSRHHVFRYHVSADQPPSTPAANRSGGQGEIGGNDSVEFNHDPGTRMHEWGHNLNLQHGGDEGRNCKPSYVSVMNYDHQFGIRRNPGVAGQDLNGDGIDDFRIIDFAPPRSPGGRGGPLPTLAEDNLDESLIMDSTDAANMLAFANLRGSKVRTALNAPIDYDADLSTTGTGLTVNIDTSPPRACMNTTITSNPPGLHWHDDWTNISLAFRDFADAADGSVNAFPEREPTLEDLIELEIEFNRTDLAIVKTVAPDPVEAGSDLVYTIVITNAGPNPAGRVRIEDTLPEGFAYRSGSAGCSEAAGVVTCELPALAAGIGTSVQITGSADGACEGGIPRAITNTATVVNTAPFAGVDLRPVDNTASVTATPVDTARPTIESLSVSPSSLWASNLKFVDVLVSADASDLCDEAPSCRITDITSDEPVGVAAPDWEITGDLSAKIRAERSGEGSGRVYTISVTCTDGSGNSATGETQVVVRHDSRERL